MSNSAPTVVGVDGSSTALDAVRWAAHDAVLHHSELVLVSSTCPPANALLPTSYYEALQSDAERALIEAKALALQAVDDGARLRVSTKVLIQPPIPALLELSKTARMVVAGNRGLGRVNRALLGSVSSAIAAHTHSPLTIVRGWAASDQAGRKTIVVGTDGSSASRAALEMAFEQAAAREVSLTAVHAWSDGDFALVHANQGLEPWAWPTVREEAEGVLERSIGDLRKKYPHVQVRSVTVRDRPAHALLDHAQAAQMVVVGSHGRGGFAGMLLGSTSRKVLYSALCPVMIVPK